MTTPNRRAKRTLTEEVALEITKAGHPGLRVDWQFGCFIAKAAIRAVRAFDRRRKR